MLKAVAARANSDEEAGTLRFEPVRDQKDPLNFVIMEEYASKQAVGGKSSAPHLPELLGRGDNAGHALISTSSSRRR